MSVPALIVYDTTDPRQAYLNSKLTPDTDFDDVRQWIERIWNDSSSHKTFTEIALQVCLTACLLGPCSWFKAFQNVRQFARPRKPRNPQFLEPDLLPL
jgi:hypothetical protein